LLQKKIHKKKGEIEGGGEEGQSLGHKLNTTGDFTDKIILSVTT
jgi:hypothetical protein